MSIKVISRGIKNGLDTAMIVEKIKNGAGALSSKTRHLVRSGFNGKYIDRNGFSYDI